MKITNAALSHRKVLFISAGIFVVILLLPFIIVFSNNQPIKSPQTAMSPAPTKAAPYDPFPNGGRAEQATYSIAYPANSQNTSNTFDGGSTFIIQPPKGSYPGEPVLDVEAYDSAQNVTQKQALYIASGAEKTTITVNNMTLDELANTYQMRTINYVHIHTPTQLRLAYLTRPNALYVFRMYYSSSTSIQADEDLFAEFIKSFSLKN